jgi:hypothetical protein
VPKLDRDGTRLIANNTSCFPVLEAQETAETFPAGDLSNAVRVLGGHDQLVVESLMVPLLVIVLRVLEDRAPRMGFAPPNLLDSHRFLRAEFWDRTR